MRNDALKKACELAGGQAALARHFGIKPASVSGWIEGRVPADRCPDIEALTGVRCEELRPDVNWAVVRGCACTGEVSPGETAPAAEAA